MIKVIHISCALLTILSFSVRGIFMLLDSRLLQHRAVKILPHIIDAVLLGTGVALAVKYFSTITSHDWLLLKLIAVPVYIVLGSIALKYGKSKAARLTALLASWAVLGLIVTLALLRPLALF